MKTKYKVVLLTVCAVLLIASAAFGTIAYLTDQETVTNTFTVGQVGITLYETDNTKSDGSITYIGNEYHLIPGHTYDKDPTIEVDSDSENCWLFVKIENGIAKIEDSNATVAAQMVANGWSIVDGEDSVYMYKEIAEPGTAYPVFATFKIAGDGVDNDEIAKYADAEIVVTAYAVQADGFTTAQDAWDATFGK